MLSFPFPRQTASQYKPHTKLEIVHGVLHQKLLFGDKQDEQQAITQQDCVIFNDGHKSEGCSREEFKPFVSQTATQIFTRLPIAAQI